LRTGRDKHTLNLKKLRSYRDWDWMNFGGSAACIKWGFRDLQNLEAALPYVRGRTLALQAGGNLGIFPKRLAEEFETVVTAEPDPVLFEVMRRNAPEKNIVSIQAAFGCERTPVGLSGKRRDSSGRAVHEGLTHVSGRGNVRQVRVDDLGLHACDLIYFDIEGYELIALRGATATVEQFRPVIVVEINRNIAHYGSTGAELRSWIEARGYKRVLCMNSDEVFVPC
jgi:FkbM family methyltransferase